MKSEIGFVVKLAKDTLDEAIPLMKKKLSKHSFDCETLLYFTETNYKQVKRVLSK